MDEVQLRARIQAVVDLVKKDVSAIRTGRATPSLVEEIVVPVYSGAQKLKVVELGSITAPDPQTIVIDPWDKSIVAEIGQGILAANLGFNPQVDGEIIRIAVPPLTGEDRERYIKLLSQKIEGGKVMIRQIRADKMREIRKAFENRQISEDERFREEKVLQETIDKYTKDLEGVGQKKEQELRQI